MGVWGKPEEILVKNDPNHFEADQSTDEIYSNNKMTLGGTLNDAVGSYP